MSRDKFFDVLKFKIYCKLLIVKLLWKSRKCFLRTWSESNSRFVMQHHVNIQCGVLAQFCLKKQIPGWRFFLLFLFCCFKNFFLIFLTGKNYYYSEKFTRLCMFEASFPATDNLKRNFIITRLNDFSPLQFQWKRPCSERDLGCASLSWSSSCTWTVNGVSAIRLATFHVAMKSLYQQKQFTRLVSIAKIIWKSHAMVPIWIIYERNYEHVLWHWASQYHRETWHYLVCRNLSQVSRFVSTMIFIFVFFTDRK